MRFDFDHRKSQRLRNNPKRGIGFEVREDNEGEYYHLVTLWRSTKEEQTLYEENR